MLLSNVMDTISEITEGVKEGKGYKITCDGTVTEFNPTDGFYNMDEVRIACGFDYFEIVYMANRQSMFLCDEEGLLYGKNELKASSINLKGVREHQQLYTFPLLFPLCFNLYCRANKYW